jgi:hypothetical protein
MKQRLMAAMTLSPLAWLTATAVATVDPLPSYTNFRRIGQPVQRRFDSLT